MGVGGAAHQDATLDADHITAIQAGIACGMTFIDTAESYADGRSETLIGRAVRGRRDDVFLASKVSPGHLRSADLIRACRESLARLGTDRLDLYQVHWPNPAIPLDETLEALVRLCREGQVLRLGLSNFTLSETRQVQAGLRGVPLFSLQAEYNLFERSPEMDLIPYCRENGLLFIAYSPLDQGRMAGQAPMREYLGDLARACGATPAQLALNFLASRGPVLPVPKNVNTRHIQENAAACDAPLPEDLAVQMDLAFRTPIQEIPWECICTGPHGLPGDRLQHLTDEARGNAAGFLPSPESLAEDVGREGRMKPVRVRPLDPPQGPCRFELVEGRLRFLAWVLAFEGRRPVPALVRS
jgi:aryl-alcohol dehydrogenase-like predicted oxidoreductase